METYATRSRRDILVTGHEDGTVKFWDISHSKSLPTSSMQSYYIATPPPPAPSPPVPPPPAPPLPAPPTQYTSVCSTPSTRPRTSNWSRTDQRVQPGPFQTHEMLGSGILEVTMSD